MGVRVVHHATSEQTVAVAPVARSTCALLISIGVPDDDLDGVVAVLADEERFPPDQVPQSFKAIAKDARRAYKLYLQDLMRRGQVVDAVVSD